MSDYERINEARLAYQLLSAKEKIEKLEEQLREQTKSFCTHCGKLFPKGKEGLTQFRQHIAECNQHPLHQMAVKLAECRRLLREACIGYESNFDDASSDKRVRRVPIFHAWYEQAKQAGGDGE